MFTYIAGLLLALFSLFGMQNSKERAIGLHYWVNEDDVKNRVEFYLRGEGPLVYLIGSGGRHISDFNRLVTELNEAGFKTVATEISSSFDADSENITRSSKQLSDVISLASLKERKGRFCIIGQDFGADIARDFVPLVSNSGKHLEPEAMVFLATNGDIVVPKINRNKKINHSAYRTLVKKDTKDFFSNGNIVPKGWTYNYQRHAYKWHLQTLLNSPRRKWATNDDMPILMIHGKDDPVFSAHESLQSLKNQNVRNVNLHIVENSSRALLPEKPEEISELIVDFLNQHCR